MRSTFFSRTIDSDYSFPAYASGLFCSAEYLNRGQVASIL